MSWTTPKTWNVGDAAVSADMNTYVRDNPAFLYGDTAPQACTLGSNCSAYGNGTTVPQVERRGNVAQFSGWFVTGAAIAGGATVFTTPYPPAHTQGGVLVAASGGCVGLQINTSGACNAEATLGSGALLAVVGSYSLTG